MILGYQPEGEPVVPLCQDGLYLDDELQSALRFKSALERVYLDVVFTLKGEHVEGATHITVVSSIDLDCVPKTWAEFEPRIVSYICTCGRCKSR